MPKVLIAEDDLMIADTIEEVLVDGGSARSSAAGHSIAKSNLPGPHFQDTVSEPQNPHTVAPTGVPQATVCETGRTPPKNIERGINSKSIKC